MASNLTRLGNPLLNVKNYLLKLHYVSTIRFQDSNQQRCKLERIGNWFKITQRFYKTNSYLFHAYFVEIQRNPCGHGHGIILMEAKIKLYTQVHASSQHALKSFNIKTLRCHFSFSCNF